MHLLIKDFHLDNVLRPYLETKSLAWSTFKYRGRSITKGCQNPLPDYPSSILHPHKPVLVMNQIRKFDQFPTCFSMSIRSGFLHGLEAFDLARIS